MSAKQNWCDPGHWAVFAFATTSFMLGFVNSNFIGASAVWIVVPVSLIFGGLVQLIVAMMEVARGNTFGAMVFGTYGPFWIIYGLYVPYFSSNVKTGGGTAVALFLAMFAVLTFFFVVASFRTDWVLIVVFVLIDAALILLAIGAGTANNTATHVGGYITIAFAVLAWYHAFAGLISGTWGRSLLPVGTIGPLSLEVAPAGAKGDV